MPLLFLLLAAWNATASPSPTASNKMAVLAQGEQRFIFIPKLKRFSIGSTAIRALGSLEKDRILVKGVAPGRAQILAWTQDGNTEEHWVEVIQPQRQAAPEGLLRLLSALETLELIQTEKRWLIRGILSDKKTVQRLSDLKHFYADWIVDESELDPKLLAEGEASLGAWIQRLPAAAKLSLQRQENRLFLSGSVASPAAKISLLRQARQVFPLFDWDFDHLPDQNPTLQFKVFLMEAKKDSFHSFGMHWPDSFTLGYRGPVPSSTIQNVLQFDLSLQALDSQGLLKILARPELTVRAPGEAEFFAGGELPLQRKEKKVTQVQWKPFGLRLKLKVLQATRTLCRLEIETEMSELDTQISIGEIPGLRTNRMKTQVDSAFEKPLFLSGLLKEGTREKARGLPLLREIPILGSLFGSEDYLTEKSELLVVLIPLPFPLELKKKEVNWPKGPVPIPRNWLSSPSMHELKSSPEYPWNAF